MDRQHRVLNVYKRGRIKTVENAVDAAMADGAENVSEALADISAAYTGKDYRDG